MQEYTKCYQCKWFGENGICDMCDFGYPYAINNHGKKPLEVKICNTFIGKGIKIYYGANTPRT